jgi:rubrerythrin
MQIHTASELYAHAIAIEREAAERYAELAQRMDDLGNVALAQLFAQLGSFEAEHLEALLNRTKGVDLPEVAAGEYSWLYADGPETAARELVFRLMTPRHALGMALTAERRAQAFFERVLMTAEDSALRSLAREMAAEEQEHVGIIERLLERTPASFVDWGAVFDAREVKQKGAPDV